MVLLSQSYSGTSAWFGSVAESVAGNRFGGVAPAWGVGRRGVLDEGNVSQTRRGVWDCHDGRPVRGTARGGGPKGVWGGSPMEFPVA